MLLSLLFPLLPLLPPPLLPLLLIPETMERGKSVHNWVWPQQSSCNIHQAFMSSTA